ncbi:50S ribosomal protein L4 [Solitalea koreensis]|uniref:Large ribosomal subunit protein uL4 n=1 Tax=Solitalea koreensis TaxID=543615 RepID=A0A521AJV8_9SPHI|nr:50S ribosomal protein L4 [Solitalea koreensis]SMO35096.1 LSU ribosomal protein L4P [Solitalea koreensis]
MEVKVLDITGKETGKTVTLADAIFGIEPNDHAIYLDVKQFLANQRQGTHKSKQRNEISGSTRKLHKQKGTGGSRKGSIKNPLFRGGGRIFGPQPRDYSFKLNKKLKSLARLSALAYKAQENNIVVIEDFNFETPKTKNYESLVSNLKLEGSKTLLVLPTDNKNVYLASRNLQKAKVTTAADMNTYDLLNAGKLLLTTSSVKTIEESFAK